MSVRMHVHSVHQIEYGAEGFNQIERDDIYDLLKCNGCDIWTNDESDPSGQEWEIDAEQFEAAVKEIKEMSDDEIADYLSHYDYEFTKKDIVEILESFIQTGAKGDGNYHFSWF